MVCCSRENSTDSVSFEDSSLARTRKNVGIVAVLDSINALVLIWIFEWKCRAYKCDMGAIPRFLIYEAFWPQILPLLWVYIFVLHGLQLFIAADLFRAAYEVGRIDSVRKCRVWFFYSRLVLDTLIILECFFITHTILMNQEVDYLWWFFFGLVKIAFRFLMESFVQEHLKHLEKLYKPESTLQI